MSQGAIIDKERPEITALGIAGYGSKERPPTKANGMKMKKMKKH